MSGGAQKFFVKPLQLVSSWVEGEPMEGISISDGDRNAGSPKPGDRIARNPKDHSDRWLVSRVFFEENFELVSEE